MPIKHSTKRPDINNTENLANPGTKFIPGNLQRAALFKVDMSGKILNSNKEGVFLLNPSEVTENKSAKWIPQEVPGQSDPVWQWLSSGPRTVIFDALVTAETSSYSERKTTVEQEKATTEKVIEAVADYAIELFDISILPAPNQKIEADSSEVLDISRHLNYYRSLLYPHYSDPNGNEGAFLNSSPPLLVLLMGNSLSNIPYSVDGSVTSKQDIWILTDLKIRITKQLSNLAPMEAVVSFTLAQYNIRSFDSNRFYKDTKKL